MPATGSEKRGRESPPGAPGRRSKRGKYTPVACDECKKRKLKCLPSEDNSSRCRRCAGVDLTCTYASSHRGSFHARKDRDIETQHPDVRVLGDEVKQLQSLVGDVVGTVRDLTARLNHNGDISSRPRDSAHPPTAGEPGFSPRDQVNVPKEPQFVGPTRSAYTIEIGERSLTQMGIPSFTQQPQSGSQSPINAPKQGNPTPAVDFWRRCDAAEITRLIKVFQEEVEAVYPCLDTRYMAEAPNDLLELARHDYGSVDAEPPAGLSLDFHDLRLAKVAIAIAITSESIDKNADSIAMIESVERTVSRITKPASNLKDLQLLAMLSIYFFLVDEDLLAWRTIGHATREALVMGLHRRATLMDIKDEEQRSIAVKVFWTIYVLDRRWSFGTSLPFALQDSDIDTQLLEPGSSHEYLQCVVGYGRLSSALWDSLMSYAGTITSETTAALDLKTQRWLESIPPELQLPHPRFAPPPQPRVLHRLRAMLYLRGNHTRILIYRHHLLTPKHIKADPQSTWLVVELAQDSIQVLVHLNKTSDIYRRQQPTFNYFLLSAMAVLFLAVCQEPATFSEPCRESFFAALNLVKDFSRYSRASRRLWDSLKGLIPRLERLGMRRSEDSRETEPASSGQENNNYKIVSQPPMPQDDSSGTTAPMFGQPGGDMAGWANPAPQPPGTAAMDMVPASMPMMEADPYSQSQPGLNVTTPDLFQMSNDLTALFNVLEQGQQQMPADMDPNQFQNNGMYLQDSQALFGPDGEISRRFQGLI